VGEIVEELLPIDLKLRLALFGLECALGVSFDGVECERVFNDAATDQVAAKLYLLFDSPRLIVSGRVDEYEPESMLLHVGGGTGVAETIHRVLEGSEFHAFRLRQSLELES
jgi:hypothetical protein